MIPTNTYIISIMNSNGEGFYLTLPNNISDLFPENKPSEYTTRLPQWVHLNGEWEIGLSDPLLRDCSGLGQALAYLRPLQRDLDKKPLNKVNLILIVDYAFYFLLHHYTV